MSVMRKNPKESAGCPLRSFYLRMVVFSYNLRQGSSRFACSVLEENKTVHSLCKSQKCILIAANCVNNIIGDNSAIASGISSAKILGKMLVVYTNQDLPNTASSRFSTRQRQDVVMKFSHILELTQIIKAGQADWNPQFLQNKNMRSDYPFKPWRNRITELIGKLAHHGHNLCIAHCGKRFKLRIVLIYNP